LPATVIVGGQFGSEGKGKVACHFAREKRATFAVRVGGSNSGHTVIDETGTPFVFRMLPTAAILPEPICVLGAGSYIDIDVLFDEIGSVGLRPERLAIDPNAYVVTDEHKRAEAEWSLGEKIGSTLSGTGAALIERAKRMSAENLAQNNERLKPFIQPVRSLLRAALQRGENVILEGTQGFGLSVLHSPYYPKATSRDTTAAAFVSEAGLSPLDVDDVVLVLRAFPIRVAGDSGELPSEIDWETVSREGHWKNALRELTSVTKKVRRVGRFDPEIVREAIAVNQPTKIVLNHLDYFDFECAQFGRVPASVRCKAVEIEMSLNRTVNLVGLSPRILIGREDALVSA
jgi:adenylosuccinate synthase